MSAPESSPEKSQTSSADVSSLRESCWVCGSNDVEAWREGAAAGALQPRDLMITDSRYGLTLPLVRCRACNFRFAVGDQLSALEALYAALEDPGYEESSRARELQMDWLVSVARGAHPAARRALDVGAAAGLLVAAAQRAGLEAIGIEPSASLASHARQDGLDVRTGVLPHPELACEAFDLVFLVDVLEHVADPVALLRACRDAMCSSGRLLVVTPDVGSIAARVMGRRWWHFRLAHVGYFDRRTLARALDAAGLEAVEWRRARWCFPIGYLLERLKRYLPIGWLDALLARTPGLRRIRDVTVPLDLRDSYAVVARRVDGEDRS